MVFRVGGCLKKNDTSALLASPVFFIWSCQFFAVWDSPVVMSGVRRDSSAFFGGGAALLGILMYN